VQKNFEVVVMAASDKASVQEHNAAMTAKVTKTQMDWFAPVKAVGLTFPDVVAEIRYDGSPVLKARGCFMAGLAAHESAEPGSLVVRVTLDERAYLLEDAPETYYVTDYHRTYPLVLVRLAHVDRDALRDLLAVSWRLTVAKARKSRRKQAAF
jgi:hypothetical protein